MRRLEAYNVLSDVEFRDRHAHLVLKEKEMDPKSQAFVSALVYTVLQHSLFLDYQFQDLVDAKLPKEVALVIKMACAQYFKMDDVPDYALVNEYVELTKTIGKKRYSGVVNAVLKKVIKRGLRPIEETGLKRASIEYSMPLWILNLLSKQYDEKFAIDYAIYCQEIKPSYVRINTLKDYPLDMSYFDEYNNALIAKSELFRSDYLENGVVLIQDINSQKVVPFMNLEDNLEVLDCCCGPGTKTSHIAALMNNTGQIDGVELHQSRADKTSELMERVGATNATIITSDVLEYQTDKKYDRILLDAPCSGLGVLSHKHDLRYHIKPEDLDALVLLQADMLDHVATLLEVDGILVYATCTLNRKENEKQVEAFLARNSNYELLESELCNPMETLGDGFYIAQCRRTC
ncbi:methyltransferase domain-containing protein [Erysipelothrix sp. HDW6A]|uniref:transcription antitermination factor NusB n=1 Tax=Erysipelothrix sp. HDW6A TaxID=2714928 RepID=UPI00140D3095|nr:transcription antitermination factor NusB [Erysipelothrix sp. HDW6A]QIK57399.1 methyltransferase domain-containing protein [Erysipelothrix sp. HDW6A]